MSRDKDISDIDFLSLGVLQFLDPDNCQVGNRITKQAALEQLQLLETKIQTKTYELQALAAEEYELQILRQQLIQQALAESQ